MKLHHPPGNRATVMNRKKQILLKGFSSSYFTTVIDPFLTFWFWEVMI